MYSAILLMAMSGTASEAQAGLFRRNDCYGCTGWAGCIGCSGASAGHACYGWGHGWNVQHVACYGYSLNCVGFACFGSYPTYFVGPVTPYHYIPTVPAATRENIPAPKPGGRGELAVPAPAEVTVTLPADAKLFAQGQPTRLTSAERHFRTPALPAGEEFHYTLRVEVVRDGRTVSEERRVAVRAGEQVRVEFGDPAEAKSARK